MQSVFKREDMLTVSQFAARIGMSRRWAYDQVEKGKANGRIFAFRFGAQGGLRIPRAELG